MKGMSERASPKFFVRFAHSIGSSLLAYLHPTYVGHPTVKRLNTDKGHQDERPLDSDVGHPDDRRNHINGYSQHQDALQRIRGTHLRG
jgi:hypothetical protein